MDPAIKPESMEMDNGKVDALAETNNVIDIQSSSGKPIFIKLDSGIETTSLETDESQPNSANGEAKAGTSVRDCNLDPLVEAVPAAADNHPTESPPGGRPLRKKPIFRKRVLVPDSDSDDDDEEGGGDSEFRTRDLKLHEVKKKKDEVWFSDESSDSEKTKLKTPNRVMPYRWFIVPEVTQRQYGCHSKFTRNRFCTRAYGSLHSVERMELMYKMEKHTGCVNALHFNDQGTRLVTGSDDLKIIIWDWTVAEPVLDFESGHRSNVFQTKFMPFSEDCHVISCGRDGDIRLHELSTTGSCKDSRRVARHKGPAHKLSIEYNTPHCLLSCGEDGVVYEIDLRENRAHKIVTCREGDKKVPLNSVFGHPFNDDYFLIGGRDQFARLYDKRKIINDQPLNKFCPHHLMEGDPKAHITCVVYNHDGSEILSSYNDEDIYTFDSSHSEGADYTHKYFGHRNSATVKGVNYFGPKSEFIVSGSDCGRVFFWEHDSEQVVQMFHGDEGGVVNCLEPHPHMPVMATSGLDDDIKIWVPSCEKPPKLASLDRIMKDNEDEREEERRREADSIDGQMLWFIMHHLRRSARRRARQARTAHREGVDDDGDLSNGEDLNLDDDYSTSSSSSEDEGATGGTRDRSIQCPTS